MDIPLDIGHANGTDSDANGISERMIAKLVAAELKAILKQDGHEVTIIDFPDMSNEDDLKATVRAVNAGGFKFGLSLHCDSSSNLDAKGAHVCYYPSSVKGKKLATFIADSLCPFMPGRADKIVARFNLYVLKKTLVPWVLVEMGFVTNLGDSIKMKNEAKQIAARIAVGIKRYIEQLS